MSDWTLLCDFDGTISVEDTTDTLLERFGKPGWEKLEDDWKAGRIGSRECMAGQVALLDMSRAELDAHLVERAIDPGFAEFVAYAKAHGMPIEILSDGLDHAIHFILRHYDFDYLPVTANRLEQVGEREWRLGFPNASATCRAKSGTCKCAAAASTQGPRKRVLMIGDGASDYCVAESADFVFAKGKLVDYCRAKNIPHASIRDFAEALALLPALVSGKLVAATRAAAAPLPNAVSA
ncbi:MAG: MtnX-like HAD-IB family phosphatase [Rudaea sp.]|uniref:MtnX-like HAD-IB family phosphatase n=1 Tax=Rudaea sp. TaxID=2136325 RepID=UPI0039E3DC93